MTDDLPLFAVAGPPASLLERMRELAVDLLLRAGEHGVAFDEVRMAAETRGLLTGEESGRFLSFGDGLMRSARGKHGFIRTYRRSKHKNSHRRRLAVHVHENYATTRATA